MPEDSKFAYLRILFAQKALKEHGYIDTEYLVSALHAEKGNPLPDDIIDYLCKLIKGEIKKKRGRKAVPDASNHLKTLYAPYFYPRLLENLQHGRPVTHDMMAGVDSSDPHGITDHSELMEKLQKADPGEGPSHKRAAMIVSEVFGKGAGAWRSFLNMMRSQ